MIEYIIFTCLIAIGMRIADKEKVKIWFILIAPLAIPLYIGMFLIDNE